MHLQMHPDVSAIIFTQDKKLKNLLQQATINFFC